MEAKDFVEKLERLNTKVGKAKTSKAQKEGMLSQLFTSMKTDFGVEKINEAKSLLRSKKKEWEGIQEKLAEGYEKLAVLEDMEVT